MSLFKLEKCVDRAWLDWSKIVLIATDVLPQCAPKVVLVGLLTNKLKKTIMLPRQLFTASSNKEHSMDTIGKCKT